jgi:3-hydroxyisobutyrate dehydrogenase-like beta-hydroxyacid dehydrogenase
MGQGMAASLVRAGFNVSGYDVFKPSVDKFSSLGEGASPASSPAYAAKDASLLILMVQNALQAEDVLFGSGRVVDVLPDDAIVLLSSTVAPSFVKAIQEKLHCLERGLQLVDAPVSGGVVRAANGTLTVSYFRIRRPITKGTCG